MPPVVILYRPIILLHAQNPSTEDLGGMRMSRKTTLKRTITPLKYLVRSHCALLIDLSLWCVVAANWCVESRHIGKPKGKSVEPAWRYVSRRIITCLTWSGGHTQLNSARRRDGSERATTANKVKLPLTSYEMLKSWRRLNSTNILTVAWHVSSSDKSKSVWLKIFN